MSIFLRIGIAVALMLSSAAASAATVMFDFSGGGDKVNGQVRDFSATSTDASTTVNVRASAWSYVLGQVIGQHLLLPAGLGAYNEGLGVSNIIDLGPNSHSVDNVGSFDFIAFQFDQAVELETARLKPYTVITGKTPDNDSSVGYGNTAFDWQTTITAAGLQPTLSGLQAVQGTGNPWIVNLNPGNNSGNLWIVGADFFRQDKKSDGFKLNNLVVQTLAAPPPVPEPATWAMLIVGFGAVGGAVRRRRRQHSLFAAA